MLLALSWLAAGVGAQQQGSAAAAEVDLQAEMDRAAAAQVQNDTQGWRLRPGTQVLRAMGGLNAIEVEARALVVRLPAGNFTMVGSNVTVPAGRVLVIQGEGGVAEAPPGTPHPSTLLTMPAHAMILLEPGEPFLTLMA